MASISSALALTALVCATVVHAAEPTTYRCERLVKSMGFVYDISDRGSVVGTVERKHGLHAAVWRHQYPQDLPNPAGYEGDAATAWTINRAGDVAGYLNHDGLYKPVLWTQGVATVLPQLSDTNTISSAAVDINVRGHVVGYGSNAEGISHALLWKDGEVVDLGALDESKTSQANAVNARGVIVGQSESNGSLRAVQWPNGPGSIIDLGATAFGASSNANAVNRDGVVVGVSSVGDTVNRRPIGWIAGTSFNLKPPTGVDQSRATGINDAGTVVGAIDSGDRGALVWPHYKDKPIDLNTLLDTNGCRDDGTAYRLTFAGAINNRGEILAGSYNFPHLESFRLVPVAKR